VARNCATQDGIAPFREAFVNLQALLSGRVPAAVCFAMSKRSSSVPDAVEAVAVSYLVLTDEDLARALSGGGTMRRPRLL